MNSLGSDPGEVIVHLPDGSTTDTLLNIEVFLRKGNPPCEEVFQAHISLENDGKKEGPSPFLQLNY